MVRVPPGFYNSSVPDIKSGCPTAYPYAIKEGLSRLNAAQYARIISII